MSLVFVLQHRHGTFAEPRLQVDLQRPAIAEPNATVNLGRVDIHIRGQYVENLDRLILGMPRELQRLNGHNKQSFLLVVDHEPSDQDALSFQDKDLDTRVFSLSLRDTLECNVNAATNHCLKSSTSSDLL